MRPTRLVKHCIFFFFFFCFIFFMWTSLSGDRSEANYSDYFHHGDTSPHKEQQHESQKTNNDLQYKLTQQEISKASAKEEQEQQLDPNEKIDYHDYKKMEEDKLRVGPGEQGVGVRTTHEEAKKVEELYRANGFNGYVSDKISLRRSLKDIRHKDCLKFKYSRKLPSVSLIVPFHQEHFSTLVRTFVSCYERAPPNVIKEIILVDDFSKKPFLKQDLEQFIEDNYKGIARVVRATKREGLIRTRLLGAKNATSDVLIFLDSHCECLVNWLPPLIDPIGQDYKTVTCPFIDVITHETFEYHAQDEGARGAFSWEFLYKRLPRLPGDENHPAEPFDSPIMAGGLFAISRKWFWELGGYDPGLEIWGGEQYELSFKLWQCGGRMIDIPCSRIGHIYRKFAPFPNPGIGDFIGRNYKRIAEVWMDEYKQYLYMRRPNYYEHIDPLDLTEQREVRTRLKCKPFKWFMENIAFDLPKHYPMIEPGSIAEGEIRNVASNLCIDSEHSDNLKLNPCKRDTKQQNGEQAFDYTWREDIRPKGRNKCFDYTGESNVILFPCHGGKGNQLWIYNVDSLHLKHSSAKCLDANPARHEIVMSECADVDTQKWKFEKLNSTFARDVWRLHH